MRRKLVAATLAVLAVAGATVFSIAAPASAQTGYPPGGCTTRDGTQHLGTVEIGQRFVAQLAPVCLFDPGAAVTVTVNGVNIPGKTAEANGVVLVDVTVVSATQLSIEDPVLTPASCAANTIRARGPSQGGISTQTANFAINCPATPVAAARPVQGRLSLTGGDSARYAAIALALVVAGSMFVIVARRRRADSTL